MSAKLRWFEEYSCGCVSRTEPTVRDLLGYCPQHGKDQRAVYTTDGFRRDPKSGDPIDWRGLQWLQEPTPEIEYPPSIRTGSTA